MSEVFCTAIAGKRVRVVIVDVSESLNLTSIATVVLLVYARIIFTTCLMTKSYSNEIVVWARRLLTEPAYAWMLACLVVLGDSVLTQLIVRFIRCEY